MRTLAQDLVQEARASSDETRYGIADLAEVRQSLANLSGADDYSRLFVGAGADGVLSHLFAWASATERAVVCRKEPYQVYPMLAARNRIVLTPVEDPSSAHIPRRAVVFWDSPSAIKGIHDPTVVLALARARPDVTVVLDAAYEAFVDIDAVGRDPGHRLLNVVTVHSMSKGFGLPGIRLGWCEANPELLGWLARHRDVFPISSLAGAVAVRAASWAASMSQEAAEVRLRRNLLAQLLVDDGLSASSSQGNFLWVDFGSRRAALAVLRALHESDHILVRHFDIAGCAKGLRITVPDVPEPDRLAKLIVQRATEARSELG
jgi:histidinol-phosphate aminotransferase